MREEIQQICQEAALTVQAGAGDRGIQEVGSRRLSRGGSLADCRRDTGEGEFGAS